MINKKFILTLTFIFITFNLFSFDNSKDTSAENKINVHFVGLQANALVRQLFNFSNSTNAVNNPYLLTYSIINKKSKWGVDAGVGYTLNSTFINDGNVKSENYINDLFFRLGVVKLIPLNTKFSSTFNMHVLIDLLKSETKSESDFGQTTSKVNSISNVIRYGAGPCLGIKYKISNRVFIGTEASYYFKMGTNNTKVTTTNIISGGQEITENTESKNDLKQFMFNVPAVLFLTLKF